MALQLDRIARFAETLMVDECQIVRLGRREDTITANWNETTGTYDDERVAEHQVYRGKCMIYSRRVDASQHEEGGEYHARVQMYASLPLDVMDVIAPEDVFRVMDSQDPTLRNQEWLVEIADESTHRATTEVALLKKMSART